MTLIPHEDLARSHERYWQKQAEQAQARPKTKAELLSEIVADFPDCTVAELATAAERSLTWVRRTLKNAGIELVKTVHRMEVQP